MKVDEVFENAIAGWGDWKPTEYSLGFLSETVLDRYYKFIDEIDTALAKLELYKISAQNYYIMGRKVEKEIITKRGKEKETKLEIIFKITFSETSFQNEKFYNVDEVEVKFNSRGVGIALQMYRYFIKKMKFQIMGDEIQFFGARKLWAKLSKMTDITVDIIDILSDKYLEKNVIIHQGKDDWDYDFRVWGENYDSSKKDIRLILKDL
jgi:hypothetical protein